MPEDKKELPEPELSIKNLNKILVGPRGDPKKVEAAAKVGADHLRQMSPIEPPATTDDD